MSKNNIKNFYKAAVAQKEFNSDFWNEVREISTEGELKIFIEEKVQPVAKKMGYDFSTKDLLNYEKQMARRITEQQLETVNGGVSAKNLALGGMFSLMALGAGIVGTTNSASALLTTKEVAQSTDIMETAIAEEFEKSKILPIQDEKETGETKKDEENSHSSVDGNVRKKDIPAVNAEQAVAGTSGLGAEQSTVGTSDLRTEQVASDISDLETAKAAVDVDPKEVFETRKLTDGQQLYVYEALNLQEAYALLKSGVVENVRFYGNIMEIETVNGIRRYTSDKGDAFIELLYMLYPSPAGDLNTNTNFKGRNSFAMYGGMSSELVAKFFAILNDYRNSKIEIPEEFKYIALKEKRGEDNLSYINPEFKNALAWLKAKGLLTAKDFEKVKAVEDAIKRAEELKEELDLINFRIECIRKMPDNKAGIADYCSKQKEELKKEPETNEAKLEFIKKLEGFSESVLRSAKRRLNEPKNYYKEILKKLNSTVKSIESSGISEKAKFLIHFINTMKKATELEVTDGSSYPKYLTEHILMSYMCQTLNNSEDVRELYQKIAEQLSQNETNKTPIPEEKKAAITEKIAAKKEEIAKLNDIIKAAEIQELSPYKSATQPNGTTFKIGAIGEDGNVQIQDDTFADCADIAARHIINLLTFANEQNWDLILNGVNIRELNAKLKEVVDAIGSKSQVKFYDLKTRLQMFFLYQRGFIKGIDNEEDREYRSKNGADDVTPLARTLWEYVICNMNEENLKNGLDKDKGFYSIAYSYGKNHEIETGYINMLKLMWNIAKALDLESEALESAKGKINALSERVKPHDSTMFEKEDSTAFEEALRSIFSLFYTGGEIEFTLADCKYAKINRNDEVKGNVTVNVIKGYQKLNFKIKHSAGHGEIKHKPVNFNFDKYLKIYWQDDEQMLNKLKKIKDELLNELKKIDDDQIFLSVEQKDSIKKLMEEKSLEKIIMELNKCLDNDFEKLLLRSFINDSFIQERITPPVGFYGTFSEEELTLGDAFRNTALYEKCKALSAYEALKGDENNAGRINRVLDVYTMRGAKKIVEKRLTKGEDGKQQVTEENLCDVFYREFLEPHEKNRERYSYIDNSMCFHDFGEVEEIYNERGEKQQSFDVMKINEKGEVQLFIKNVPENGELIIPSIVYDKDGKEYRVERIDKCLEANFENLKKVKFTGDFKNLNLISDFSDEGSQEVGSNISFGNFANFAAVKMEIFGYAVKIFTIQGNMGDLIIERGTLKYCDALRTFAIQGNIGYLSIWEDAFYRCENLKNLIIRGDVKEINLKSGLLNSSNAKIFLPENLKNKIPENFEDKNKIIFYDITDDDTLHLKVNEAVSEISLDKETLETLGGNFQILQAKNLNEEIVEIIFDDDLKDEFLKIEDATGLHYERKRA